MDKYELTLMRAAFRSLRDSTAITVLFPGGVRVDIQGRNGRRPEWEVSEQYGVITELGAIFLDNGKYSLAISEYEIELGNLYFGNDVAYVHVVLPRIVTLRVFRLIYPVFLVDDPVYILEKYLHRPVTNIYLLRGTGESKYVKVL